MAEYINLSFGKAKTGSKYLKLDVMYGPKCYYTKTGDVGNVRFGFFKNIVFLVFSEK